MADNNQPIEWYLARDGQQHGPVTDAELTKIIELGYLRPTDLVWRQGMAEWATAESVLDLRPAAPPPPGSAVRPAPAPTRPGETAVEAARRAGQAALSGPDPAQGHQAGAARPGVAAGARQPGGYAPGGPDAAGRKPAHGDHPLDRAQPGRVQPGRDAGTGPARDHEAPERRFPWRIAVALVLLGTVAAAGMAFYRAGMFSALPFLAAPSGSEEVPVVSRPERAARESTGATASPMPAEAGNLPQPLEQRLQRSPLWKVLKAGFPEWYAERVADIAKLSAESKSEREIDAALTRSIVELRRKYQVEALAASPDRIKAMAASFVESLARLSRVSTAACYGYISQGEASPAIADLTSPEQRLAIDAQLATIFEAIADGRRSPARRDAPKREDYDVLSKELAQRGWSAADLQIFTDARALSRAAPEKVCQMVQDWFAAQLSVADDGVKLRLLSEALKPVVAG